MLPLRERQHVQGRLLICVQVGWTFALLTAQALQFVSIFVLNAAGATGASLCSRGWMHSRLFSYYSGLTVCVCTRSPL
jgi:hypothetical protein